MTNSQYPENFSNHIETMDACKATMWYNKGMVMTELANKDPPLDVIEAAEEEYRDTIDKAESKYFAAAFLTCADVNRFGSMLETLQNDYLRGDKDC